MLLDSILTDGLTAGNYLLCTITALGLGFLSALLYQYKNHSSRSFTISLVLLPAVVQTVILLVNGNLGIGVAVAGAFSLVRFRSVPGTAKEITMLFMSMAIGLATGTGCLLVAVLFAVLFGAVYLLLCFAKFGEPKAAEQELRITIPESLDYSGLFDDILSRFTAEHTLLRVKTTNMGSLYELTYRVVLRSDANSKQMIDVIRTRNGNLNISLGRGLTAKEEL